MPRQQQREGGNQQQQQQVRKHLLRIAAHNVRGMHQERKTQLLVRMWMDLDLDMAASKRCGLATPSKRLPDLLVSLFSYAVACCPSKTW
jgi:hypothetical protein